MTDCSLLRLPFYNHPQPRFTRDSFTWVLLERLTTTTCVAKGHVFHDDEP